MPNRQEVGDGGKEKDGHALGEEAEVDGEPLFDGGALDEVGDEHLGQEKSGGIEEGDQADDEGVAGEVAEVERQNDGRGDKAETKPETKSAETDTKAAACSPGCACH